MRTANSFLPLLRPFIIKLVNVNANANTISDLVPFLMQGIDTPVHKTFDDGHLRLLELLLCITTRSVGKVDGVADLDVIGQ